MYLLQVSDLHIESFIFDRVLLEKFKLIVDSFKHDISGVVISGDVFHKYCHESLLYISDYLNSVDFPVFISWGNHDSQRVSEFLNKNIRRIKKHHFFDNNLVYCMDTRVSNQEYGEIKESELKELNSIIAANSNIRSIVVLMHHHPIDIHHKELDDIGVINGVRFQEFIKNQDLNLKWYVLFGHIHHGFIRSVANITYMSCRSPAFNIQPLDKEYSISRNIAFPYNMININNKTGDMYAFYSEKA